MFGNICIEPGSEDVTTGEKSFVAYEIIGEGKTALKRSIAKVIYYDYDYPHVRCMAYDELKAEAPRYLQIFHDIRIDRVWAY